MRPGAARGRRRRFAVCVGAGALIALIIALARSGGGHAPLPLPGIAKPPRSGDPFAYNGSRRSEFEARAIAGSGYVLFAKSPGGVVASAARVAAFRGMVDAATSGTAVDPNVLEGIVFLESAGRPNALASPDPAGAAGLTQILAQTGQSLLGMHVDLARSRRLTVAIDQAAASGRSGLEARLQRQRAKIDDRFDPRKALAATVRYLELAQRTFGRADLAVVSYHMGMGNLGHVLTEYDAGRAVPYAQLYFDTALDHHPAAYDLLSGFGDDSSLYYWRVRGAMQIMGLYRSDRRALRRLAALENAGGSDAEVLHPPDQTRAFADPGAIQAAYAAGTILPLPSNSHALGLAYDPAIGALAHRLATKAALYRGLRSPALDLLIELAARVRTLCGGARPLIVTSAVSDLHYQHLLGVVDVPAAAGWSFTIARRYVNRAQAVAFQAMLDRLQALNLIAWMRFPSEIEVTVASDAARVIADGV